jgi:hypothetical protein
MTENSGSASIAVRCGANLATVSAFFFVHRIDRSDDANAALVEVLPDVLIAATP